MKNFINNLLSLTFILVTGVVFAQSEKPDPAILEAQDFVAEANDEFASNEFAAAESAYRKAVAKDPANTAAKYNMGNNYYRNKKYGEGMNRYIQAAEVAQTKAEKHKAFHNLGNAFYQQKDFKKAVEAYKNALRNDPTDEETRYNLALAKKEEEKNGGGGGDDENQDQNQDQNEDQKDQDGEGDDKESDDGKPKDQDDQGDEKKDQGDENKDDKGKPEDKDGDQKDQGKDGDKEKEQQQPKPGQGQLSPQQVKSLLEAMKNEENKVQDKINAQKVKGAKVKTDKDW